MVVSSGDLIRQDDAPIGTECAGALATLLAVPCLFSPVKQIVESAIGAGIDRPSAALPIFSEERFRMLPGAPAVVGLPRAPLTETEIEDEKLFLGAEANGPVKLVRGRPCPDLSFRAGGRLPSTTAPSAVSAVAGDIRPRLGQDDQACHRRGSCNKNALRYHS